MSTANEMFDSLVLNAFDFFNKSIAEFKEYPKYSIINFYSAIELFLKAGLMQEHWTLLLTKPENAIAQDFLNGNFQSVGLDDAIKRLSNITGQKLTRAETDCFEKLKNHRNRLVHFFHEAYEKPGARTLEKVVSEQCTGWFYMHKILEVKWKDIFRKFSKEIAELDRMMKQHQKFLDAKFQALQNEIEIDKKKGIKYSSCEFCNFESVKNINHFGPIVHVICRVCDADSFDLSDAFDILFDNLKPIISEKFEYLGFVLSEQDGDVENVTVNEISLEEKSITSVEEECAEIVLITSIDFSADASYWDYSTATYDSEDKELIPFDHIDDNEVNNEVEVQVDLSLRFKKDDPQYYELLSIVVNGDEDVEVTVDDDI